MELNKLLALLRANVSGERAIQTATAYRQFPLKLGFSPYNEGIAWLCKQYAQLGLNAQKLDFPADGKTVFADRHFPLAWDIEDGWLRATGSTFPFGTLASYHEDSYGIVPFSADSNGEQSAFIVPAAELRKSGAKHNPSETVVLFDTYPGYEEIYAWIQNGYKAAAVCVEINPDNAVAYNARRWLNALFDAGQIDARSQTLCAYSLPPVMVARLLDYYKQHGPIPVKYLMRTKTYPGIVSAALARLEGTMGDNQSLMVSAHAYEPNATNDVSGVAICLEAAKILTDLINDGKLPKPRRSIQFFHGLEIWSLYAYAVQNPARFRKIFYGLSVDSLGCRDHGPLKEKIILMRCFNMHPSFCHFFTEKVLSESVRQMGLSYEVAENGFPSNDDMVNDPMFGPAWNMIYGTQWFDEGYKSGFYHANVDTVEHLAPERLAELAVCIAAAVYAVADAGSAEALAFAALAYENAIKQFTAGHTRLMAAFSSDQDGIKEKGIALKYFHKITAPSSMTAIESTLELVPEAERDALRFKIQALSRQFKTYADSATEALLNSLALMLGGNAQKLFKPGQTEAEKTAAVSVPTRRLPGLLGLGTQSKEARMEAARMVGYYANEFWNFMGPLYYWFDGKRTLLDAAMAHYTTTDLKGAAGFMPSFTDATAGEKSRLAMVEKFVALAEFLEKHGYLAVTRNQPPVVTKEMIIDGLNKIGVKRDDVVMVHSSLSQFGEVRGGADAVIDALMEVIGEDGIIAMPAFTDAVDGGGDPPFDPAVSKVACHIGVICDTFWKRKGVLRSAHPSHSVAAWGKRAAEFLRSENPSDTFDWNGPWGKLYKWNGKILSFGETFGATTCLHALEAWFLPYLDKTYARVREGNSEKLSLITNYPDGCRGGWYKLRRNAPHFKRLYSRGLYHETKIGAAAVMVINVRDFTREIHALFKEDPAILLHKSGCQPCAERRAKLRDWQIPGFMPDNTQPD